MMSIQPIKSEQPGNIEEKVAGEITVKFEQKEGFDSSKRAYELASEYELSGLSVHMFLGSINACVYHTPAGKEEEIIKMLEGVPGIVYAERSNYVGAMVDRQEILTCKEKMPTGASRLQKDG